MVTFGHGRLNATELTELVEGAGITEVVDVRRLPGSRTNHAAAQGEIPRLLDEIGIGYRWDERLGGRRSLTVAENLESPDTWWRVKAFRAFAAWTRTDSLRAALPQLLAAPDTCALMCSEAVWWRCHRRLISDVLVLEYGVVARHLMHDGRLIDHVPSPGARRDERGWLVWDGPR